MKELFFDSGWEPVRRTAEKLTMSTMCVWKFPTANHKPGTRLGTRGMSLLTNHGCEKGHFVPLDR